MNCQEMSAVKKLVIDKIQEDENLMKAIGNVDSDFKDHPTPPIGDLLSNNIYKYRYPRTLEGETKVILSIDVSLKKNYNKTQVKEGSLILYVFTHVNLEDTVYNIIRSDYIINKLDVLLNNSTIKNILGDLQFVRTSQMPPIKDWTTVMLEYSFSSFNDNKFISDSDYE